MLWVSRRYLIMSIAIGAVIAAVSYLYLSAAAVEQPIVVAAQDIPAYTWIDASMLRVQRVPAAAVHPQSLPDPDLIRGQYATRNILSEEAVLSGILVNPGSQAAGMPWQLEPGQRAMAVPCPPGRGAGGTIAPGHLVDLVHFRESSIHGPAAGRLLLTGVKVLDVRNSSGSPWRPGSGDSPSTAVLAVAPNQAEILAYAMSTGDLFLTVSPYDPAPLHTAGEGATGYNLFGEERGELGHE